MKILSAPKTQIFSLTSDPDGTMMVSFRQGTYGTTKDLAKMTEKRKNTYERQQANDGQEGALKLVQEQTFNWKEEPLEQIFLTVQEISGCINEADGKEAFEFVDRPNGQRVPKNRYQFMEVLCALPDAVIEEMHRCCLVVNPQWGDNSSKN